MYTNMKKTGTIKIHSLKNYLDFEFGIIESNFACSIVSEHSHSHWTMFIFDEGEGKHLLDFKMFDFQCKSIHIVQPYQIHQLIITPASSGLVLMFDEYYFDKLQADKEFLLVFTALKLGKTIPIFYPTEIDFKHLWNILIILKDELNIQDIYIRTKVSNYLNIIFCQCIKYLKISINEVKSEYLNLYYAFISLIIEKNILHPSIDNYAKKLACSTKQLRSACVYCSGITPLKIVHSCILHQAKKMLLFEQKSVKDVAYELNFTDIAHFTHFFKAKTGRLPSKFKIC